MNKIDITINNFNVILTPDKALFPGHFIPPILWSGFINGVDISIIQLKVSAKSVLNFNFKIYPDRFNDIKLEIIKAIDNKLRVMD